MRTSKLLAPAFLKVLCVCMLRFVITESTFPTFSRSAKTLGCELSALPS